MVCFLTGLVAGCVLMFLIHNPTMEHEAPSPNPTVKSEVPSPNPTVKHESPSPNPTVKHEAPSPKQTLILMWLWPFGVKFDIDSCRSTRFDIDGCKLTDDRKMYNNADAVLFHHREIRSDLSNMPPSQRPPFQKWVWMNFEPPSNSPKIPGLRNLFNLTLNYRLDADITLLSGKFIPKKGNSSFPIPNKSKLVCWVVSNWKKGLQRVTYYEELIKHIHVDGFGHSFNKPIPSQGHLGVIKQCKFYLSFENSIHKDYMTEKLFNPLSVGTVPVVLGTSRQNYENFLPGDAFIHVDDFPSPKELAEHIRFLDKNEDAYRQYFNWHKHYEVQKFSSWAEHVCFTCDYIRKHKEYKVINDLDKWYWG
ncbi:hypothetical protein JZ751_007452 [Albula glossodonta]|uniref:Fucosyltransferase n=1 Tax=Albula glossodonta TaxID=121402 RepID=A0A8T2N2D0_9TELE|nr:hypothetical protein JZ751_007452 [Albula glossodonta]